MTEDNKPFTVKDRRHFTPEGDTREGAPEEAAVPPSAPAEVAAAPAHEAAPDAPHGSGFPRDFASLLVMLGSQASMMLAGVEPGETEPGSPDLEGAQDVITLLESLQAKTQGHRTEDEERLLSSLLYELRMAWVSLRRGPGA